MRHLAHLALLALLLPAAAAAEPLTFEIDGPSEIEAGVPFALILRATGGIDPISWCVGLLPPGARAHADARTLTIEGTVEREGLYTFELGAHDATTEDCNPSYYSLFVRSVSQLVVATKTLPPATRGEPYEAHVRATTAVAFSISSGALPEGITLDPDGTLSGVSLDEPGVYAFAVEARGLDASRPVTAALAIELLPANAPKKEATGAPSTGCSHGGALSLLGLAALGLLGQSRKPMAK